MIVSMLMFKCMFMAMTAATLSRFAVLVVMTVLLVVVAAMRVIMFMIV